MVGAFGQVTVNDVMVGKYTSEEWRSRAYAGSLFRRLHRGRRVGGPVGVALYQRGGLATMLHTFAGLCLLLIAATIILPAEIRVLADEPIAALDRTRLPVRYICAICTNVRHFSWPSIRIQPNIRFKHPEISNPRPKRGWHIDCFVLCSQ